MRLLQLAACAAIACAASSIPEHNKAAYAIRQYDSSSAGKFANRPELINYNPVAATGAVVIDSSNTARFTVLTPRLIRCVSTEHMIELWISRGSTRISPGHYLHDLFIAVWSSATRLRLASRTARQSP
jgi:hypothetical protein